ncbi:cyclic AMP-dependent transcription factor ATF-4-like [Homarus americanus]|uniref:Activating transcription factor of chaperone-like n=1 Tax=Homarus americanus TaxID=6706 RepID=A0A8J5T9E1_HOMAM|nr:cyclic AMP-dependent transcription factor ATF-4-like [Homarus americanus]KAG7173430.1 Activating transcription factor of chaperone-like [Homarus americanus]
MEYDRASDLQSWLFEDEQDFSLGAKATSYLPSATLDTNHDNANFELPDWMESRENLGLANVKLFDDVAFTQNLENDVSQSLDMVGILDDDYCTSIKPEDMLVPLSELQPQKSTPQGLSANPSSSTLPPPKIIICMKRVAVCSPITNNDSFQGQSLDFSTAQSSSVPNIDITPNMQLAPPHEIGNCDADGLINEMVQMIGKEGKLEEFNNISSSLDTSMYESDMEDLLLQLESSNSKLKMPEVSSLCSEPVSPISVPSPVPSAGSLSPSQATCSFFSSHMSTDSNDKISSAHSPAYISDFSEKEYQSEVLAHSLSPRKRKSSSLRSTPYPENRRERKKEQNKQAALRYRQKKKQEEEEFMSKIEAEEERQKQLKAKYSNLKQELTYLKKIMREVFIAKGVISEEAFKKNKTKGT